MSVLFTQFDRAVKEVIFGDYRGGASDIRHYTTSRLVQTDGKETITSGKGRKG